jgi:hypothetical protein
VALFASVQQYFESALFDAKDKVRCTNLPPIYFQHRGHSLTIVGLERHTSGALELLVFDPVFHDPASITQLRDRDGSGKEKKTLLQRNSDSMLKIYRRGHKYLKRYDEFEILRYVFLGTCHRHAY